MSIDAFSNLIQKPQTGTQVANKSTQHVQQQAPVAQAPVVAEPQVAQESKTKNSKTLDFIKQAAPIVVPLATIPVSVILANRTASTKAAAAAKEAATDMADEVAEKVKKSVAQMVTQNKEEMKTLATDFAETAKKNSNDIWKVIGAIGAGFGIGSLATGGNNVDNLSQLTKEKS